MTGPVTDPATGPVADPVPAVVWRRSMRARRISLRFDVRSGGLVLTLPPRATKAAGQALLRDSANWIAARAAALPASVVLADGAWVPVHGVRRQIVQARGLTRLDGDTLYVGGEPACLTRRVTDWLRAEAARTFAPMAHARAAQVGRDVTRVVLRDTRTRWGSCTGAGVLMFSWRLVMAPPWVQEYVVAHEVAHRVHMHHGPAFWALLDGLCADRAAAEAWLAGEGVGLLRVG